MSHKRSLLQSVGFCFKAPGAVVVAVLRSITAGLVRIDKNSESQSEHRRLEQGAPTCLVLTKSTKSTAS